MSMPKCTKEETKTINKAEAKELLKIPPVPCQRTFKQKRFIFLLKVMNQGDFRDAQIAIGKLNGDSYLANGNHTLPAFCASTLSKMRVTVSKYRCNTRRELADLYRSFDPPGSARSAVECLSVDVGELGMGLNWHPKFLQAFSSGIVMFGRGMGKYIDIYERTDLLYEYLEAGKFLHDILCPDGKATADVKHVMRGPVVCAMIATYEKSQKGTKEFWTDVIYAEGLTKTMPSYKLNRWLLTHSVARGRGAHKALIATEHEMVSRCIVAWNAYRKGASTKLQYSQSKPIPLAK